MQPKPGAAEAFLAAQSLGIASLAERLANALDVEAAATHLLGLLHAARRWLDEGGKTSVELTPAPGIAGHFLPPWLSRELDRIELPETMDERSPSGCVARSLALVDGRLEAARLPEGFAFDPGAYASQLALARVAWLRPPLCGEPRILAARLQRLAELGERFDRRLEQEKLDALKELAYGAGHEINNPLANISARARPCWPANPIRTGVACWLQSTPRRSGPTR